LKSTDAEDWGGGRGTEFYLLAGSKHGSACCLFHARLLLGLTFNTEDGDNMFLQSVIWLSSDYMALYPRTQILHNHPVRNINPTNIVLSLNTRNFNIFRNVFCGKSADLSCVT
jgi:hypothetical protein